jgi:hypothetical protein
MKELLPNSNLKQPDRSFPLSKKKNNNFSIKRGAAFFFRE